MRPARRRGRGLPAAPPCPLEGRFAAASGQNPAGKASRGNCLRSSSNCLPGSEGKQLPRLSPCAAPQPRTRSRRLPGRLGWAPARPEVTARPGLAGGVEPHDDTPGRWSAGGGELAAARCRAPGGRVGATGPAQEESQAAAHQSRFPGTPAKPGVPKAEQCLVEAAHGKVRAPLQPACSFWLCRGLPEHSLGTLSAVTYWSESSGCYSQNSQSLCSGEDLIAATCSSKRVNRSRIKITRSVFVKFIWFFGFF